MLRTWAVLGSSDALGKRQKVHLEKLFINKNNGIAYGLFGFVDWVKWDCLLGG